MPLNCYCPFGGWLHVLQKSLLDPFDYELKLIKLPFVVCNCKCSYRFPFDWKNPIGFLFTAIITYTLGQFAFTFLAQVWSIGIGMCLFLISLTKDIKSILNRINESGRSSSPQRSRITKHITEYVRFHSNAKEFSRSNSLILLH